MKTRFALLITIALLAVGLPIPAHAATPFQYTVSNGEATITGYNGTPPTNLVVPADITDGNGTYPVTTIGDSAFANKQLTDLDLPDTVTTIGGYAFAYNRLADLDLSDTVTTISDFAFADNLLTNLDLPSTLTTISFAAFYYNRLTTLDLPTTITTISDSAFAHNQLIGLTLSNTVTTIGDSAFADNQLTGLTLPNTITTIGNWAFSNNQLTDLTLPNTITTIGSRAFSNNQLTDLTLPNTITTIGGVAFAYNQLTELDLPDALTTIGQDAFLSNQLTELAVPASVTSIGPGSFAVNPELDDVRFAGAAPSLGHQSLGKSDTTVRFPWKFGNPRATSGYTIPTWKGYNTIAVADVTFDAGDDFTTQPVDIGHVAAKPADPIKAKHVFTGWLADGATTPFDFSAAITGDVSLTADFKLAPFAPALTGPTQVTTKLGADVSWTPTTLTGNPASTVTATGLPDGLKIDSETGVISGKVTDAALSGIHNVTITASNGIDPAATLDLTISVEGFAYSIADDHATITGYHGAVPTDLVIPGNITDANGTYPVTTIGDSAFNGKQLTELTLADKLTTIGDSAFANNTLTELTLPNTLTTIDGLAFGSNRLTELTLPDSLTTVGNFAFMHNMLAELTLPSSLTTISAYAFAENQLTELTIPNPLATIGNFAFAHNQLTDLTLPDTLTTIGYGIFADNQLTALSIPDMVVSIGDYAFHENPLTSVVVGGAVSRIGSSAFGTHVATVRFTGAAPQLGAAALGTSNPTVRFPWRFGSPRATGGYTAPSWNGYATIAVADVTFDRSGATSATPVVQQLDVGALATKPADPVKPGHKFTGWYLADADEPFDFTAPIAGDITLTAVFEAQVAPVLTGPQAAAVTLRDTFEWTPTTLGGSPAPTVTATGLPDGLEIDSRTGVISGKVTDPALAGNHDVAITASNEIDPAATFDLTISIEYFTYSVSGGDATITGYRGAVPTKLVIPDEITDANGTYPVTAIGKTAFDSSQLTELTLPNTLATIGQAAFYNNKLTELTLPNTLTTVDEYAFHSNQLTELTFPNALTTIGDYAFVYNRLTTLVVPASVTSIGREAFRDNSNLDDVRFTGAAPQLGGAALGTSSPSVRFPWRFGSPRANGGYTTPLWHGYDTIPVADVTFAGGGIIATQSVDADGTAKAVKPADPAKAGHVFTGWFADGATAPFDFTKPITGDVGLTAGFAVPEAPGIPGPGSPSPGIPSPGSPIQADPAITGLDPAITGTAREGKTLRTKPGKVTPSNATITYQWRANGKTIKGATKPWLPLRKAQAGKRISVTITAKSAGAPSVTKTSAKTKPVSSAKRRLVLSTYKVGKNKPVTVTATGFKARQKVIIWLGGDNRYAGRADSRGVVTRTVAFAKDTKPGKRRVRVSGYDTDGDRNRTVLTAVRYR